MWCLLKRGEKCLRGGSLVRYRLRLARRFPGPLRSWTTSGADELVGLDHFKLLPWSRYQTRLAHRSTGHQCQLMIHLGTQGCHLVRCGPGGNWWFWGMVCIGGNGPATTRWATASTGGRNQRQKNHSRSTLSLARSRSRRTVASSVSNSNKALRVQPDPQQVHPFLFMCPIGVHIEAACWQVVRGHREQHNHGGEHHA